MDSAEVLCDVLADGLQVGSTTGERGNFSVFTIFVDGEEIVCDEPRSER